MVNEAHAVDAKFLYYTLCNVHGGFNLEPNHGLKSRILK